MEAWMSAYEYPKIISVVFLLLFLGVLGHDYEAVLLAYSLGLYL